ncbi:MAG: hypothetical protein M9941_00025 [Anaerolineae bacterium]|nr:hypothetical protein [Anaerolineae bacterium]
MVADDLFLPNPHLGNDFADQVEATYQAHTVLAQPLPVIPAYGVRSAPPSPDALTFAPTLQYHVQQFNALPAADTTPELAPSAATRMPFFGRIWATIRSELHNVILFYVNRLQRTQTQQTTELVNIINEMSRIVADQHAAIEQLQQELEQFKDE